MAMVIRRQATVIARLALSTALQAMKRVSIVASGGLCLTPWELAHLLLHVLFTVTHVVVQFVVRGSRPLFPKWTLQFEVLLAVVRMATSWKGNRYLRAESARVNRWQSELFGSLVGQISCWYHGVSFRCVRFGQLEHLWLRQEPSERPSDGQQRLVVMYIHGGGFSLFSPRMYISFCTTVLASINAHLAKTHHGSTARVEMFLANYRKLPEHELSAPGEDALRMYEYLLEHEKLQPKEIILAGDSSGGCLVMSTLLRMRAKDKARLPLAAMLICPYVDFSADGDERLTRHCILTDAIAQGRLLELLPEGGDPSVWGDASSVHCDLSGLPPVLVQAATLDYIYRHALRLMAKAKADGATDWQLDEHEGVPHVFAAFPTALLPYAAVGVARLGAFAAAQFAKAMDANDHR